MNKKMLVAVSIIISLLLGISVVFVGVKVANTNKINRLTTLGIKNLKHGKYEDAIVKFSKVMSIDSENEKAVELLALTEDYLELENLYKNKDYLLASDLLSNLNENKYLSYIEDEVNEISIDTEAKVTIINEINNLDKQIEQLTNQNKFQEAIDLINKYLNEELKEEYLNKLNELKNKVNNDKVAYEQEQIRLVEEARLEAERLAKEERKKKEEAEQKVIENRYVNLIVEGFYDANGYTYINADEVYWEWINEIPGYRINGIDGGVNSYKLSYNCTFGKQTLEPTDPEQGEYINFNEFRNEIVGALDLGYPPRARLCIAQIVNGEIIKISTVYTP